MLLIIFRWEKTTHLGVHTGGLEPRQLWRLAQGLSPHLWPPHPMGALAPQHQSSSPTFHILLSGVVRGRAGFSARWAQPTVLPLSASDQAKVTWDMQRPRCAGSAETTRSR